MFLDLNRSGFIYELAFYLLNDVGVLTHLRAELVCIITLLFAKTGRITENTTTLIDDIFTIILFEPDNTSYVFIRWHQWSPMGKIVINLPFLYDLMVELGIVIWSSIGENETDKHLRY